MSFIVVKIAVAAGVVGFASWLAGSRPELAGFITALPLISLLALAFSYGEHHNLEKSSDYARSIILAVPVSWLFFLPFFFVERFQLSFWQAYGFGVVLLVAGFFLHQWIMKAFF